MTDAPKKMNDALGKVLKRRHYPIEVMPVCVRWYVADPLSLPNLGMYAPTRFFSATPASAFR